MDFARSGEVALHFALLLDRFDNETSVALIVSLMLPYLLSVIAYLPGRITRIQVKANYASG